MSLPLIFEPPGNYDPPSHKHDFGYRYLLSDKRTFCRFLRSFIDADWVWQIDERKVLRLDKSFILQDFKNREADIVYQLSLINQNVVFYLLVELQASVDFTMPFRLLQYMVEIWRSYVKDMKFSGKDFRLPVIIPCVLYNGQKNWTACKSFGEYQAGFEMFSDHALNFKYLLIDVNRYKQEELLQLPRTT